MVDAAGESTTIRATCAVCQQDAEYQPSAFHLTSLETTTYQINFHYEFFCVLCRQYSRFAIENDVFTVLRDAGVPVTVLCGPDECADIFARQEAPTLTEKEVGDWVHQLLEHDEAVQRELLDANER